MDSLFILLIFFFGLGVGSFLNVVIIRGERQESFGGRSYCETCGRILSWKELIPVASFVLQRRRCVACHTQISYWYPVVEISTGILYSWSAWRFMAGNLSELEFTGLLVGLVASMVILVSDLRYEIIPTSPTLILGAIGVWAVALRGNPLYDVGGALAGALMLFLLWLVSHGQWMGLGDAKLAIATSLIVGFPQSAIALLFAFWTGGIAGGILILLRQKSIGSRIPFGPFILLGTALAYFFTQNFLDFIPLHF